MSSSSCDSARAAFARAFAFVTFPAERGQVRRRGRAAAEPRHDVIDLDSGRAAARPRAR